LGGLLICGRCLLAQTPLSTDVPRGFSIWDTTVNLDAGVGYKDNILLGPLPTERSAFVLSGLDLSILRLSVDGTRFLALVTGSDQRYFSAGRVEAEQALIAHVEVKKELSNTWQWKLSCEYAYLDQVLDATDLGGNFGIIQAQGHTISARPGIRRNLWEGSWLELEFGAGRQFYKEPLDDDWEGGPKLVFGHAFKGGSELSVGFQLNERVYDQRSQRRAAGALIEGATLAFLQPRLELVWEQHWDKKRRWRTSSRLGYMHNLDNGSGYYDYARYGIAEQLRYRDERWEIRAQVRCAIYDYAIQPVSIEETSPARRVDVDLGLRIERRISKVWRFFVEYGHERSLSNQPFMEYAANTWTAGVDWEL
jgi:hypothetical protein